MLEEMLDLLYKVFRQIFIGFDVIIVRGQLAMRNSNNLFRPCHHRLP